MSVPLPPGARTRLPRDQRRAVLVTAALTAFSDTGYHATAMEDIADLAGVSKPVLYRHFDSKLALYLAIAGRVEQDMVATTRAALAPAGGGARDRFRAWVDALFAFVGRPDSGYPLVFATELVAEPAVAVVVQRTRTACGQALGELVQEQTGLGWPQCLLIGVSLTGQAQAAARHWCESDSPLDRARAVDTVTDLAWRGLVAVGPGPAG